MSNLRPCTPTVKTLSAWDAWSGDPGETPRDWQSAVYILVETLFQGPIDGMGWLRPLRAAMGRLSRADYLEAEPLLNELAFDLLDAGAVLGFALARTWTGNLEDLADWPDRALAYAGPVVTADERHGTRPRLHAVEPGEEDAR